MTDTYDYLFDIGLKTCPCCGKDSYEFPNKYNIIYADPPWSYRPNTNKERWSSADNHYNTMTLEDIKDLPVQDLSADDCILFIWVSNPLLDKAFEVIDSWGFNYKTVGFTWAKKNKIKDSWFWGMGYWTRSNAELCLIATKGSPKRESGGVHQLISERIRDHSQKPEIVRDKIVELCGDLPRIELFARERCDGWDSWGDELP